MGGAASMSAPAWRGGMFGGEDLSSVLEYTEAHGGGTIAVDSQSGASSSIIEDGAEVAGIGGFSGKESTVSVEWLEERIESGAIAWIYTSGSAAGFAAAGAPAVARPPADSAATPAPARNRRSTPWSSPAPRSTPPLRQSESSGESTARRHGTLYQCSDS